MRKARSSLDVALVRFKKLLSLGFIVSAWLLSSAFTFGTPFRSSDELNALSPDAPVIVGMTHVTVGDDRRRNDIFWDYTFRVADALSAHEGYLGHKIRKKIFGNEGWTMTVWKDEESLNDFVRGKAHADAIQNGLDAVSKARFARVTLKRSQIPLSWTDAEAIMKEKGRDLY
jgi:heme-degrading monooxygenase HmoA